MHRKKCFAFVRQCRARVKPGQAYLYERRVPFGMQKTCQIVHHCKTAHFLRTFVPVASLDFADSEGRFSKLMPHHKLGTTISASPRDRSGVAPAIPNTKTPPSISIFGLNRTALRPAAYA